MGLVLFSPYESEYLCVCHDGKMSKISCTVITGMACLFVCLSVHNCLRYTFQEATLQRITAVAYLPNNANPFTPVFYLINTDIGKKTFDECLLQTALLALFI